MKVSEALENSPFDFHYRRKFERIVEKAGVGDLDLDSDWYEIQRRVTNKFSFNLWGLLFGGLWAAYRHAPYAAFLILLGAASIAAPELLGVDEKLFRALPTVVGAMCGFFGNSWLLSSYLGLMREYGDEALVERETRPSLLSAILALLVVAITGIVIETPANELRSIVASLVPSQGQAELASSGNARPTTAVSTSDFPSDYNVWSLDDGGIFGMKMIQTGNCGPMPFKCGKFEVIFPKDCDKLTATYKIFDSQMRHIDTDSHSVRGVTAFTPVLMKFYMFEPASDSFEVTEMDCS